jgi:hypothetical protein
MNRRPLFFTARNIGSLVYLALFALGYCAWWVARP